MRFGQQRWLTKKSPDTLNKGTFIWVIQECIPLFSSAEKLRDLDLCCSLLCFREEREASDLLKPGTVL
jgi:hypothetical protein